ncbi:unnamed protein product [Oncorhynchus mykiss]|uniref:Uncharacterized protein n=1 Tax=Oncorhynchus mykiss TaxID=8022 RepID=A0A060Y930_ONCMY|nr:unnamed protein product [Oncorhynchus mykiss]
MGLCDQGSPYGALCFTHIIFSCLPAYPVLTLILWSDFSSSPPIVWVHTVMPEFLGFSDLQGPRSSWASLASRVRTNNQYWEQSGRRTGGESERQPPQWTGICCPLQPWPFASRKTLILKAMHFWRLQGPTTPKMWQGAL